MGSGESSLAGALGERKKRKREDSTTDTNFDPVPGRSHIGYVCYGQQLGGALCRTIAFGITF